MGDEDRNSADAASVDRGARVIALGTAGRASRREVPDAGRVRSRSEAALAHQLHAMSALLLFNEGVSGDRPYDELLQRLTAELPTILEARLAMLVVAEQENGPLALYWSRRGADLAERQSLESVPVERLRGGGTEAWVKLLDRLPDRVREELKRVSPERLRITPIGARDRLVGLLVAGSDEDAPRGGWAWHHVVARNVATATQRLRRNRELVRRAYFDTLTGLPNRDLFQDRLTQAVARARRTGLPLAVLYLDLDDFKWVNDTLGHHAGDELLKRVATALALGLRETDTVARLAGDEFAILLPDVGDARQIEAVLAALRTRLQTPARIGTTELELRASIGIAVFPLHGTDADTLLRSADAAMYRVKRARAVRRQREAVDGGPRRDEIASSGALL